MNLQWQKYPHNARKLFKLTIPIFISQLSASGMGLADIVMAGLVSDDDVSAIAVSNSIYFPTVPFCARLTQCDYANRFLFEWFESTPPYCSPSTTRLLACADYVHSANFDFLQ